MIDSVRCNKVCNEIMVDETVFGTNGIMQVMQLKDIMEFYV